MISFVLSIIILVLGYLFYGRLVEKSVGIEPAKKTPAYSMRDGKDYIPMPGWKVYMIQFLNIAGTGPIFGAIMGSQFGPASYLWIVFGCIFAGGVHDYLSGMISLRHGGILLPQIIDRYLGTKTCVGTNTLLLALLILTGAVFVYSPALILNGFTTGAGISVHFWIILIFAYYFIATLMPIDRVIGKIYPVFAILMLFMAISLGISLFLKWPSIPEIWDTFLVSGKGSYGAVSSGVWQKSSSATNLFPMLFITIACGAISGFHATQSPLMARCIKSEKTGRPVFYGSMITEGVLALIWAAIGSYFFYGNGAAELGAPLNSQAPAIVSIISTGWLGTVGGILAIIGVVVAPISTGDTALRCARLIIQDFLSVKNSNWYKDLMVAIPLFTICGALVWFNISNPGGFNTIWRYFGWLNQSLSAITLWALTVFLVLKRPKPYYLMTLVPAVFVTSVCTTYICVTKIGLNMPDRWIPFIATSVALISLALFYSWLRKVGKRNR